MSKKIFTFLTILISTVSASISLADSFCEDFIQRFPETVENPKQAIRDLLVIKDKCVNSGIFELELGRLYLINKDYENAKEQFSKGLKNATGYEKELELSVGNILMSQADYDGAISVYSKVIEKYPDFYLPYLHMGLCYLGLGKYIDSISNYNKSITLNPTYEAYANISLSYFSTKNCQEALKSIDSAMSIDQERLLRDRDPMLVAVRCYADDGKFEVSRNLLAILLRNDSEIKHDKEFIKAGLYLRDKMRNSGQLN
jgi:tetratricopeptide (TPR) repeat protein